MLGIKNNIIKKAILYFPSVALPRMAAFVTMLLLAWLLPPAEVGLYALTIVLGELVDGVFCNWARIAQLRLDGQRAAETASVHLISRLTFAGFILGTLTIGISAVFLVPQEALNFGALSVLYVAANALLRNYLTILRAQGMAKVYSVIESLRALISLGLLAPVLLFASRSYEAAALSVNLTTLAFGLAALVISRRGRDSGAVAASEPLRREWKAYIHFGLPLAFVALASYGVNTADRFALQLLLTSSAVGIYVAIYSLGRQPADVIANAINVGAFPELVRRHEEEGPEATARQLRYLLLLLSAVLAPLTALLFVAGPWIVKIIYPEPYWQAAPVLGLACLATYISNLKTFVFDQVFHLQKRNWLQVATLVPVAVMTFLLLKPLISHFGILGACYAYLAGAITGLLTSIFFTHKYVFPSFPEGRTSFKLRSKISDNNKLSVSYITPLPDKITGLSSYTESLVQELLKQDNRPPVFFITNARRNIFPRIQSEEAFLWVTLPSRPNWLPYKIYSCFIQEMAIWKARRLGCRNILYTTMSGSWLPIINQYVTLHDLYDLDIKYRKLKQVIYSQIVWRWLARVSQTIICVSDTTAHTASHRLGLKETKRVVIKEASKLLPQKTLTQISSERFLFVASVQKTKNVPCLLKALKRAGGEFQVDWIGNDPAFIVRDWINIHGEVPGLMKRGYVCEEELKLAYTQALALIVPSFDEGFCLPVLEAHALGVPVIASDIPVLREVAGDGALFFDPHDPAALESAMRRLILEPELRKQLSAAAKINSEKYSWEKAAKETYKIMGYIR